VCVCVNKLGNGSSLVLPLSFFSLFVKNKVPTCPVEMPWRSLSLLFLLNLTIALTRPDAREADSVILIDTLHVLVFYEVYWIKQVFFLFVCFFFKFCFKTLPSFLTDSVRG